MSREGRWVTAELIATVVLPGVSLIFLTDAERLGPTWGLVVALVPPVVWSVVSMVREGRISALAVIAVCSVLLTGGVGLLELDPRWFAVKEALVPSLLGVGVLATAHTRFAVVSVLLDKVMDLSRVHAAAKARGQVDHVRSAVRASTIRVGGVLVVTALFTYGLARWVVQSQTGTEAFGDELGRYTLLSVPVLMVPSTIAMAWVLNQVFHAIAAATGEEPEAFLR